MDRVAERTDDFDSRAWPVAWGKDRNTRNMRARIGGVIGAGLSLFYLNQPIIDVFRHSYPQAARIAMVTVVVVYSISYLAALWFGPHGNHPIRIATVAWLFAIGGSIAGILRDPGGITYLTYAIVAGVLLLPLRVSRVLGLAVAVLQVLLMWLVNGHIDWSDTLVLVLLTIGMSAFWALMFTVQQLRQARDENAKLAVAEERARLARDLHDVLGHSLTTITLKTGLARRVLESGADRERAIAEMRDVEQLSRQALSEIRLTVSGYRQASLAAEMVGARAALRAADIEADLPHAVDDVATPLQEIFAYVLREGVTNVIRHSQATRCEVRLGPSWLEIKDNGPLNQSTVDASHATGGGHGLSGLSDRLAAVGGTLIAEPLPQGGFLLRASVPTATAEPSTWPVAAATNRSHRRG